MALMTWINEGRIARDYECTLPPLSDGYQSSLFFTETGATIAADACVQDIDAHGNIMTDVTQSDLDRLQIVPQSIFSVSNGPHYKANIFLGSDYGHGGEGWVGFIHAEGFLFLSKTYADGAATLHVKPGNRIRLCGPTKSAEDKGFEGCD